MRHAIFYNRVNLDGATKRNWGSISYIDYLWLLPLLLLWSLITRYSRRSRALIFNRRWEADRMNPDAINRFTMVSNMCAFHVEPSNWPKGPATVQPLRRSRHLALYIGHVWSPFSANPFCVYNGDNDPDSTKPVRNHLRRWFSLNFW